MRQALDETVVYGCITNVDYLRSIANSKMFEEARVATKVLDTYEYKPHAIEILSPGAYTTVQDYPGRRGYWNIGVPPSGCMDQYSFRLANRIVGNDSSAPGLEITLNGPKILFHQNVLLLLPVVKHQLKSMKNKFHNGSQLKSKVVTLCPLVS